MRLDYFLLHDITTTSQTQLLTYVTHINQLGSDHIPIEITLKLPPPPMTDAQINTIEPGLLMAATTTTNLDISTPSLQPLPPDSTSIIYLDNILIPKSGVSTPPPRRRTTDRFVDPACFRGVYYKSPLIKPLLPDQLGEQTSYISTFLEILTAIDRADKDQNDCDTASPEDLEAPADSFDGRETESDSEGDPDEDAAHTSHHTVHSTTDNHDVAINNYNLDNGRDNCVHNATSGGTRDTNTESIEQLQPSKEIFIPHINIDFDYKSRPGTVQVQTMIDTGANHNLMSKGTVMELLSASDHTLAQRLKPSNIRLYVADQSETNVLGMIPLRFTLNGVTFDECFYIMEHANFRTILGNAFFHKYKCGIDYETQLFKFQCTSTCTDRKFTTIPFQSIQRQIHRKPTVLFCSQPTLLPPNMETYVKTKLSKRDTELFKNRFGEIFSSNEASTRRGFVTSNGFTYPNDLGHTYVRVMNLTGQPILLTKNSEVANYFHTREEDFALRGELHNITPSELTEGTPPGQVQEPSIFDTDYTSQGGYKNIPPHHMIPDLNAQQLTDLFSKPGLKDIPLNTTNMRLPNNDTWTDTHTYRLRNWLAKRATVFSTDKEKLTLVKHYAVNIPHNNKPTVERIRPYTSIEAKEWNNYVESMRRNNLVEYCDSPWRSAAFLIRKPNGKGFRFVTDYRKANACVPRIHWPLVRADAAFTAL
jgi:hypothetical protein